MSQAEDRNRWFISRRSCARTYETLKLDGGQAGIVVKALGARTSDHLLSDVERHDVLAIDHRLEIQLRNPVPAKPAAYLGAPAG